MSENFFIDVFEDFHFRVYRLQNFLFRTSAIMNVAVDYFEKQQQEDQLKDKELLSSISHVWDITAKDTASKIKRKLTFSLERREFAEDLKLMMARETVAHIAQLIERSESFMKDIFSALLCYDISIATRLHAVAPALVSSIEVTRNWVNGTRIKDHPFSNNKANGSGIREFLQKEFPALRKISTGDNTFNLDYNALMTVLIYLRHDITHNEAVLGSKTMDNIKLVQSNFTTITQNGKTILTPTEQQTRHIFDKVTEYAFAIAKYLSMHYRLSVADYTYSDKPYIMMMEGKFPLAD